MMPPKRLFPRRDNPDQTTTASLEPFDLASMTERLNEFTDRLRAIWEEAGHPADLVGVLHHEERPAAGGPARILDIQPWSGPLGAIREIVPDVTAEIVAEMEAIAGDRIPVLIWFPSRDGRPPSGKVFGVSRE
jgi:hypothetical protein